MNYTFAAEYGTYTPDNRMNLIGVMETYFEYYENGVNIGTSENCNPETMRKYVSAYNNRIFPLIDPSIEADCYTDEMLEDLIYDIQRVYKFDDSTIESTYIHLVFTPMDKYNRAIENQNFLRRWGMNKSSDMQAKDFNATALKIRRSFSVAEETAVANAVLSDIDTKDGEICGLTLMWLSCLRNNEAAAADFRDIVEMPNHPGDYELLIYKSTIRNCNRRKASGKTENAVRRIPIPDVLYEYLMKRRSYLLSMISFPYEFKGMVYENVDELPIACRRDEYGNRCSSNNLTNAGRILFQRIGMTEERISNIEEYMRSRFNTDDDFGERDVTTYTFRRNGGTHLYSFNLQMAYIQYYMGHLISDPNYKRTDFADEELRYKIKMALDNHPFNDFYQKHEKKIIMDKKELRIQGMCDDMVTVQSDDGKTALFISVFAKEQGCPIRMRISSDTGNISVNMIQGKSLSEVPELIDARNVVRKLYAVRESRE